MIIRIQKRARVRENVALYHNTKTRLKVYYWLVYREKYLAKILV